MNNSANQITESVFDAISIIAQDVVNNLEKDITKVCTIIDDSDAVNGWYVVSDGAVRFKAYSEIKYKTNDKVRVSIPRADFSQTKYIIGREVKEDEIRPITNVSELDSVLILEKNSVNGNTYSLTANGITTKSECIWELNLDDDMAEKTRIQTSSECDVFYVKADFQCMLDNYKIKSGSYGLEIQFYIIERNTNACIVKVAHLDSKDMFGNPYAFVLPSVQAKKYDISSYGKIDRIKIYLYQSGNFTYQNTSDIKALPQSEIPNIFVRNIETGFGADISKIEDNTLKLFTDSSEVYDNIPTNPNNVKELSLAWYNKDDNNQYIGFTDGIFDLEYDEDEYLKIADKANRLEAQRSDDVPSDETGLQLAADMAEIKERLNNTSTLIGTNLYNILNNYYSRIYDKLKEIEYDETFANKIKEITKLGADFRVLNREMSTYYSTSLKKASKIEKRILKYKPPEEVEEESADTATADEVNDFDGAITNYYVMLTEILTEIININLNDPAWKGVCQSYINQIKKIKKTLENHWHRINVLIFNTEDGVRNDQVLTNSEQILEFFKHNDLKYTYNFIPYEKEDLSQYDNRYCIYWYRYNHTYFNPEESHLPEGWERMREFTNVGLPQKADSDGYYVLEHSAKDVVIVEMDAEYHAEEKFCVVLYYNHEKIVSNELVFINNSDLLNSSMKNGTIDIIHGEYSQDNYPFYSIDNILINSNEGYEDRELTFKFKSEVDEVKILNGAWAKWYVPSANTMLSYNSDKLYKMGFKQEESDMDNYYCFAKSIGAYENEDGDLVINEEDKKFCYRISSYYNPFSMSNQIILKIVNDKGDDNEGAKTFFFSHASTNGTEYVLSVQPSSKDQVAVAPYVSEEDKGTLQLDIKLFDANQKQLPIVEIVDAESASMLGYNLTAEVIPTMIVKDEEGKDTQTTATNFDIILTLNGNNVTGCTITASENIEKYYGVLKVSVKLATSKYNKDSDFVTLTTYYPIAYSKTKDYYIDGASCIYYNNLGVAPSYYSNPYRLYDQTTNSEVEDVNWSIAYYMLDDSGKYNIVDKVEGMPKLENNVLVPATMYFSDLNCYPVVMCSKDGNLLYAQNIVILQNQFASSVLNNWDGSVKIDEDKGTILSAMLGAGRKTERNTFEGVLMGAIDYGLGDNMDLTNTSAEGTGIFGFNDGAQSFAFLSNGTGFIGKSGGGRIMFDGNASAIASANWFKGGILTKGEDGYYHIDPNSNATEGMCINLADGHIDAYNFKLSSKNLLIESNENGGLISMKQEWEEEEENEEGQIVKAHKSIVLTTDKNKNFPLQIGNNFSVDWEGGITANEGRIAKWRIIDKDFPLKNDKTDHFIGLSHYAGHRRNVIVTGRNSYESYSIGDYPTNIGLFPDRDNMIVVGVPDEDWLYGISTKTENDQTIYEETDKYNTKGVNFNSALFRVTNAGSIYGTSAVIGDVYIRPKQQFYSIDIVGLLTEMASAALIEKYRLNWQPKE